MRFALESTERSKVQPTDISCIQTDGGPGPRDEARRNQDTFDRLSKILLPEYQLIRQLSSGGFSDVYEAVETRLGRRVAIKVLAHYRSMDGLAIEQFHHEARLVARLAHHPNVVRIYNIGEKDGFHFFTMNLATGGTLRERLSHQRRIEAAELVRIIIQVLEALQFIHENGVVHGDIKPENLVLDEEGQVILTDFGISRQNNNVKDDNHERTSGTPAYISPEQANGRLATPESDLYSVGVMMYELLSGRLPFQAEDPAVMLMKHACEQPIPLSRILPQVDPELSGIVEQLMQKQPEMRPASAAAVVYRLRQTSSFREAQVRHQWQACALTELNQSVDPVFKAVEDVDQIADRPGNCPSVEAVSCRSGASRFIERIWPRAKWAAVLAGSMLAGILMVELQGIQGRPAAEPGAMLPPEPAETVISLQDEPAVKVFPGPAQQGTTPETTGLNRGNKTLPVRAKSLAAVVSPVVREFVADSGNQVSKAIEEPGPTFEQANSAARSLAARNNSGDAEPTHDVPESRSYAVRHDHIKGGCLGKLILHADYLEFISEKDKDSRRWDFSQIHDVKQKGQAGLHFETSEKDLKKLGFDSRSYRFDFLDHSVPQDLLEALRARNSDR